MLLVEAYGQTVVVLLLLSVERSSRVEAHYVRDNETTANQWLVVSNWLRVIGFGLQ